MQPEISRSSLPNGLTVVAIHRPWSGVATLAVDVRVGARFEARETSGLSHMLEHMMFQGCATHPSPEAVNDAAERLGAAIEACTSRESTHYEHLVAADNLEASARLVAELMRTPRFMSLETEREIILEEALDEFDEDGKRIDADTLSRRLLWPDVALGRSIIGELSNLKRFGLDDLKAHHQRFYGARNMVVTVLGPQPVDALHAIAREAFGPLPPGEPVTYDSPARPLDGPHFELVRDHRSQCDCRLLVRTPGRQHRLAPAFSLLRIALDDGLASRMHRRLGAELGLAYDQWASWEFYPDTGAFEMAAMVSPGKVATFFDEAVGLLQRLADDPPGGDELDRVRFRARWAIQTLGETPEGLVALHGSPRLWHAEPPTPEQVLARLDAVTVAELAEAGRMLTDATRMVACCVGPIDKATRRGIRARLRRLGAAA